MKAKLPGFPLIDKRHINIPDIGYLLSMPMFELVTLDYVKRVGANFQRKLLEMVPIVGDRKNILVSSRVQYLFPGYSPTLNHTTQTFEWHIDGNAPMSVIFAGQGDRCHILMNECTSRTEFNVREIEIDTKKYDDEIGAFNMYMNTDGMDMDLWKAKTEHFVTFENHVHRATNPLRPEFRFFFSVVESDFTEPYPDRISNISYLYKGTRNFKNIEKRGKEITIHLPEGYQ